MIARSSVLTATQLFAFVAELIFRTLFVAVLAYVAVAALASPRVRVARRLILAQTVQSTINAPLIGITQLIALVAEPSLLTRADIRPGTLAVHTFLLAMRTALVLRLEETGTAVLLQLSFRLVLHLLNSLHNDLVPRTFELWRVPAPSRISFLTRLLDCNGYLYRSTV